MPVRIRLSRGGSKKRPFYRVVVADSRRSRDGKFLEQIGTYNPMLSKENVERVKIDIDKAKNWIEKGAQPSDRVKIFLSNMGVVEKPIITVKTKKHLPKKKEEAKAAEPKAEEAKAAEPKAEEAKAAEPKAEEAKAAEPKAEEAKAAEPKAEEAKAAEPKAEEAKAAEPKAEEAKAAEPKAEEAKAAEPKAEEAKAAEAKGEDEKNLLNILSGK